MPAFRFAKISSLFVRRNIQDDCNADNFDSTFGRFQIRWFEIVLATLG